MKPDMLKIVEENFGVELVNSNFPIFATLLFGKCNTRIGKGVVNEDSIGYSYLPRVGIMVRGDLKRENLTKMMDLIQSGNLIRIFRNFFNVAALREIYKPVLLRQNLSPYTIFLPSNLPLKPELILGTRHSIKLFSFEKNVLLTLSSKPEFNKFVNEEIRARQNYGQFLILNKILESGSINELLFFKEPLLSAGCQMLDNKGKLLEDNINTVVDALMPFYRSKLKKTDAGSYINNLLDEVKNNLNSWQLRFIEKYFSGEINKTAMPAIYTSKIHGDLVPSNIMLNKKQVKLIDWTYCSCQTILYDIYTLLINIACTKGTKLSMQDLVRAIQNPKNEKLNDLGDLSQLLENIKEKMKTKLGITDINLFSYLIIYGIERIKLWKDIGNYAALKTNVKILSDIISYSGFAKSEV